MNTPQSSAKTIFLQALESLTVAEREAFLDMQCGSDAVLRSEVDELLRHHGNVGRFLEKPPPAVAQSAEQLRTSAPPPSLGFLTPSSRAVSLGRLDHYEILEVVGQGGFGIVLKAFDDKLHRVVAVKVLNQSLAALATARRQFVREAQAAAAVNHDNVVHIYAVEESNAVPYLVMEYVAGVSLEDMLREQGALDLKVVLRIGLQLAEGLAAAHRQGLVHRDVKPANILLENGVQRVKITDFGLARAVDDVSLSQAGLIAGTPLYMSPEQARGEIVDHRSDLFSLGSVFYAMCAGHAPFRGGTSLGVMQRVCEEIPRPLDERCRDVPPWLANVVARLQAKNPADRFQSAGDVADLLSQRLAELQQPGRTVYQPEPRQRPRPSIVRRAVLATAAVVLLALAGFGLGEAAGVTELIPTVIRIATGSGMLIVEVDDPAVKVTIEGDGGLVITGAGPQEVRLRPGDYQIRASKDGKSILVDQPLVTIARHGKQVVKVSREADAQPATHVDKREEAEQVFAEAEKLVKLGTPGMANDPWQSELHLRKAVALCDQLASDFPEVLKYQQLRSRCRRLLSMALNYQAHAIGFKGTNVTAEEAARAIAAGKEATELAPSDSGFWTNLGMAHYGPKTGTRLWRPWNKAPPFKITTVAAPGSLWPWFTGNWAIKTRPGSSSIRPCSGWTKTNRMIPGCGAIAPKPKN